MANFNKVNVAIKTAFPSLDIKAVRGDCYVYFIGLDGEKLDSLYVSPTRTSTELMSKWCVEQVSDLSYK